MLLAACPMQMSDDGVEPGLRRSCFSPWEITEAHQIRALIAEHGYDGKPREVAIWMERESAAKSLSPLLTIAYIINCLSHPGRCHFPFGFTELKLFSQVVSPSPPVQVPTQWIGASLKTGVANSHW